MGYRPAFGLEHRPMSEDLAGEHRDAAALARAAGQALMKLRSAPPELRDIGVAGDRLSHQFLVGELNRLYPGDDVRSEEGLEHVAGEGRLWIVDPLDGTREFGELDRADWAVHVALVVDGFPVAGAVALPALEKVWSTASAPVPPSPPAAATPPRLAVSRTRPGWSAGLIQQALSAELVPLGSAGFKALAVVRGTAEIYAHSGGQYEWDSAAPVAVALAHGMHASRLDGTPLAYNNPDPYLPDLLIAHPDWARPALDAVRLPPC